MSDPLGDAILLTEHATDHHVRVLRAAARNWHTLTSPTDELIERVATVLADHDTVLVEDAPEIYLPLARKVVDALTDTAGDDA